MPDELPPTPNADNDDDASKAETIRITLPPRPDQPTQVKRETVRINLPGKPAPTLPPLGAAPKKETTKIVMPEATLPLPPAAPKDTARIEVPGLVNPAPAPAPAPAPVAATSPAPAPVAPPPPSATRPLAPPPPRPPSQAGMPLPPAKPMSGVTPPPKPPSLGGARPTVPLKPALAPASAVQAPPAAPVKPATPKKETARITLPGAGSALGKPAMPKATVKMQQTQPLISKPAPSLRQSSAMTPAPAISSSPSLQMESGSDKATSVLSIVALVLSLVSFGLVFWAFKATELVGS